MELASRLDDEDMVVFISFFFRDFARQRCVAAVGVQHGEGLASTEDGALEGEDGSQVGGLPHEWYLLMCYVAEVVEENVKGVAKKSSRIFRSQRFWSVIATPLAEDDGVCVGVGAGREQYFHREVHACSPEVLELSARDQVQHVFRGVLAVAARVIILIRVSVAHVDGSVDKFAPLLLLGRVREIRAEGPEDYAKAHYVRDAFFPRFDAVRKFGPEFLCGEKVGKIVYRQI